MNKPAPTRTHSGTALCRAALNRRAALRVPLVSAALLAAVGFLLGITQVVSPLLSFTILISGLITSLTLLVIDRLLIKPLHNTLDTISGLHRSRESELTAYIGSLLDIVANQERHASLLSESANSERKAREEIAMALENKAKLLAAMSHEIRTPMNGIIGMTILALDTELNTEQRDYLETVKQSADSLLTIMNDILDSSKIEAGKLTLHSDHFHLRSLVKRTLALLDIRAHEKEVTIVQNIAEDVPDCLIGDETRIGQILINLLGNAIKFTPEQGSIFFHVLQESKVNSHIILHFSVTDTGIGIAEDKLEQIFEPFAQAEITTSKRFGGTGLGLSITKQLVELMNGRIWVESAPQVGSAFHVLMRLEIAADQPKKVTAKINSKTYSKSDGLRILVVEDNEINQKLAVRLLERKGHIVSLAANGQAAVEQITNQSVEKGFDLVLMDCEMPIMNGYEATKLIRAYESRTKRHLPIVAMTAKTMSGDREQCLAAGMDDYLSKPFNIEEINRVLDRWSVQSQQPDHDQQNP